MQSIVYDQGEEYLSAAVFLTLVKAVWPGEYDENRTAAALGKTINFCAWDEMKLVGCARLLSDGYFFSTISEILVDPGYQKRGIGRKLMEMAWEYAPSSLSFGVQAGNEVFFEKAGFEPGLRSYQKKKDRNA